MNRGSQIKMGKDVVRGTENLGQSTKMCLAASGLSHFGHTVRGFRDIVSVGPPCVDRVWKVSGDTSQRNWKHLERE